MTPLVSLSLATLFLIVSHFALSHPLRASLVRLLGERGFIYLFMAVAVGALAWIAIAWRDTSPDAAWVAPLWWWPIASAITLFASILLAGSLVRNPAFPRPGAAPLSTSARNLIVAGGVLFLALFGTIAQDAKKERQLGQAWRDWEARTSFVPFAALLRGRIGWRAANPGWIALLGGLAFWALVTSYHAPLVSPLGDLLSR